MKLAMPGTMNATKTAFAKTALTVSAGSFSGHHSLASAVRRHALTDVDHEPRACRLLRGKDDGEGANPHLAIGLRLATSANAVQKRRKQQLIGIYSVAQVQAVLA